MAEWSLPKKARKSNFSTDEVDVLVDSVKERYNILYGKYAKRATNRWIRHKAWMEILKRVNGVSIEKRTLQEVKNKWKKCQYAMKEKVSRGALADDDSSVEDVAMRRKNRYKRHLYNAYDLDLKKSVVIFAEENGNKEAQARYGISEANIRRWRRLKNDIFGRVDFEGSKLRTRRKFKVEKLSCDSLEQDSQSSVVGVVADSMPLQERLSKVAAQEKISAAATGHQQVLKSQPLSPTKLKVTRQSPKVAKPAEPPQSPVNEEMCLRWNSHHSNMQTAFPNILSKEQYVDVTLAAEGKTLKCHRLILSSCSPYFEEILSGISPFQHPVLFMRDIPFWILKSLCDFMYAGEVHIFQNKLEELLTVAEALKIKGLAGKSTPPENREDRNNKNENNSNNTNTSSSSNNNNNSSSSNTKEPRRRYQHQQDKEKVVTQPPPPPPPPLQKKPVFTRSNNYESTSHDYEDDLLDPLDLLEPLYEEAAEEKKPSTAVKPKENKFHQYQPVKKPFTRRLRKRKFSEQREPSPPPVFSFRKGTRSRPNVKIPKYYHSDYSNNPPKPSSNAQTDPLLDVDEIKTEPIDVEDNNLVDNYSDEDHQYANIENSIEPSNCDSPPVIITSTKSSSPQQDKFKKIKLSKPIITEVHTIEEANTTPGGLEVIKITVQQSEIVEKKAPEPNDSLEAGSNVGNVESTVAMETEEPAVETEEPAMETEEPAMETEEPQLTEDGGKQREGEAEVDNGPPVLEAEVTEGLEEAKASVEVEEKVPEEETAVAEVTPAENPVVEEEEAVVEDVVEEGAGDAVNSEEVVAEVENPVQPVEEVPDSSDPPGTSEEVPKVEEPPEEEAPQVPDPTESGSIEESITATEEVETVEDRPEEEESFQQEFHIQDVRSTALDELEQTEETEEERRTTSLNHLEKEAMNVANAINMENQAGPPDIE